MIQNNIDSKGEPALKTIMERITPTILEFENRGETGHIEIHFLNGKFTRAKALPVRVV